ncbi:hypothetical protein F5876DRAFT_85061 [Lentinula aff. lateritia]|uniref:Uncharacterized protein n=1 Tax=Lentinula aff. lateritia TaxID=2804960 RepID=A0ACC1TG65_9AGAR|nr:hypothetical protein F5876DRAFT_85061 [Lentinula aff. lateritia]
MRRSVDINTAFHLLSLQAHYLKALSIAFGLIKFSGSLLVTGDTAAPTWLLLVSLLYTLNLRGLTA